MTSHTHESHCTTPLELFCSYVPDDQPLFQQLEQRLAPLQRAGYLILRHRGQIAPGANVETTLSAWEAQASLIMLLVSPAYLADPACEHEAQQAVQRSSLVIPVILRPCDWSTMPFAGVQCLPRNGKAIISWLNQDEAWQEVTEEIRRAIDEVSLSGVVATAQTSVPRIWNVPFARNPFFTGRNELLELLHTQLHTIQATAVSQPQAVSGLGGIGKTQLAIEYAYRYASEYQAVLWTRAETTETLNASYTEIAGLLRLPQRDAKEQEVIVQAVKGYLGNNGGWLLILDNADEPEVLPSFLPPASKGQVLVTTRAADLTDLGLGFGHGLTVETFSDEQGALFLLHRSNQLPLDATLDQADKEIQRLALEITRALGGLPLALDQSGAYLKKTKCGLAAYQQLYQQHRGQLFTKRLGREHPEPVATTWDISFAKVEQANPTAADLLRFCAFLAPDAIPEELLGHALDVLHLTLEARDPIRGPKRRFSWLTFRQRKEQKSTLFRGKTREINEAVAFLRAYSLIDRDPQVHMLTMHRLVQTVIRDSMPIETRQQWMQHAVQAVDKAFSDPKQFENWPTLERLLPHSLACVVWIEQTPIEIPSAAHLLNQAGYYLSERARYTEAELLYQRALSINEQKLGAEHPDTARCLNNLGNLYLQQRKHAEAEPTLRRALTIYEQKLGAEHLDTTRCLNNLATVYEAQGKYAEAEPMLRRALDIREHKLGAEHPGTATFLNNLASLYEGQDKYIEAESLHERALSIREHKLGAEHPDTANSLNNLAHLYQSQGRFAEAESLYRRALSIYEQHFGTEHPDMATRLNNLASLYQRQGRSTEAEPLYRRALSIYEQHFEALHPDTARCLNNLARLYSSQSRSADAEPLFQRALTIREQILGPEHPDTARTISWLAVAARQQGHLDESKSLYEQALAIFEHTLGSDHPDTQKVREYYADLLSAMQDQRATDEYAETPKEEG